MVDFIKNECDCNGIPLQPYATTVDLMKLIEWAEQKDRQIEELRLMVDRLAFKDIYRYDMNELHINWKE